jgi:hypothetical protein
MKAALNPNPIEVKSRALLMLAALERAGVSPVETDQLHAFAFFANVLSPLWSLAPLQGAVLKREAGPFYKELQEALDRSSPGVQSRWLLLLIKTPTQAAPALRPSCVSS